MLVGSLAEVFENMKARLLLNWDLRDAKIYLLAFLPDKAVEPQSLTRRCAASTHLQSHVDCRTTLHAVNE
jgi:hypothetical protein